VALLLAFALPAAAQTASGKFASKRITLDIAGAYSYWEKSGGTDAAQTIKVAVSNAPIRADMIDRWYDRGHVMRSLFADDEVKVVHFEFTSDGRYRGYSYYFESGDGCGYCFDSKVKSTVRAAGGRLQGKISWDARDSNVTFDVDFNVPIPEKIWGDALPAGGGELSKIYATYRKALEAKDVKGLRAVVDSRYKQRLAEHEKQGDVDDYLDFRWDDVHLRQTAVKIVGGFVRGERAVLLVDGSSKILDRLHGDVIFTREGGVWLVSDELFQLGAR
jgi:hypothetical protein